MLIDTTAMMQEIRQNYGLTTRKSRCGLCSFHRTAEESGSRKESWRRRTSVRELVRLQSESRGQLRLTTTSHLNIVMFHNRMLTACSADGACIGWAIARVMPKSRLRDAFVSDWEDRYDCRPASTVPTCRCPTKYVPSIALVNDIRTKSRTFYGLFDRVTFG
jgi:hypothetical protein